MQNKPYILIIEDEESLSQLVKYNLEKDGFEADITKDGELALEMIEKRTPDLIVLDWMLPSMSGIELCKEIRSLEYTKQLPIIMLTARSQEDDRLKGFSSGADDYMTKPFSPKELIARIRSVLKRANPSLLEAEISYGGIRADNNRHAILVGAQKLDLSPLEYGLLHYMLARPAKVHTRDMLLRNVWHDNSEVETRTVDVCIRRIRAELERVKPGLQEIIKTVRGEGYILEKD